MEIVPVARMDDVIRHALVRRPEPIEWDESKAAPVTPSVPEDEGAEARMAH
jgi:ATP-dependent Lon protease